MSWAQRPTNHNAGPDRRGIAHTLDAKMKQPEVLAQDPLESKSTSERGHPFSGTRETWLAPLASVPELDNPLFPETIATLPGPIRGSLGREQGESTWDPLN